MKKFIKIQVSIVSTLLTLSIPIYSVGAMSDFSKSNQHKPVPAQNVEIVKKVTVKGASQKPDKTTVMASTGTLGEAITGTKYAIVIGISDYPGTGSDLQYGDDDAREVKNILINKYNFKEGNITTLIDSAASGTSIFETVKSLRSKMTAGDELVFFYSGHGAKGKAADGDSNNTDQAIVVCNDNYTGFDYIWDGELKNLFANFPTNHIVFIFDSCLSGGMNVLKEPGRIVNMACSDRGVSYEGAQWGGGHGQFTYYFAIQGMSLNAAESDLDSDNNVTIEEAFDYAKANCMWQIPTIADGFINDLLP